MPQPIRVLLVASDPRVFAETLELDREARLITDAIRRSRGRDALEFATEWAVGPADLQHVLLWHRPEIVHFCGHGQAGGGLLLAGTEAEAREVDAETLRALFAALNGFVRMVVLNACDTLQTARRLAEVVDVAIGMNRPVSDHAAGAFAAAFYGTLASASTVRAAFDLAVNQLRIDFPEECGTPCLLAREGADSAWPLVSPPARAARPAPGGAGAADTPLHRTVRFAAACFPGLLVAEFDRVVRAVLGEPSTRAGDEKDAGGVEARSLRSWGERPDAVLAKCGVKVAPSPGTGAPAVVHGGGRADVHALLAGDEAVGFHAFLREVHRAGLALDPSPAIAGAAARLTAQAAAVSPGAYGAGPLLALFARVPRGNGEVAALARFAYVLRCFYAEPHLVPAADAVFERLLAERAYPRALALASRVWPAPGFDHFGWLRRVVDGGDERTRRDVYAWLRGALAGAGTQVYAVLGPLASWLPRRDRAPSAFTPANRLALRLLPEHAVHSVQRRVPSPAGQGAPEPLLTAANGEVLRARARLLAAWLFHPGLAAAFGTGASATAEANRVRGTLVAEWAFILGAPAAVGDCAAPAPGQVLAALLGEIVRQTGDVAGRAVRQALLAHWAEMEKAVAELARLEKSRSASRGEQLRRRDLLRGLAAAFYELQRGPRPPAAPLAG